KVDKDFNIKLYGDYVIEKGDYLFTLENIINKRFTINQGGTIKWTGEPYDADINLTAVYKVKTSLYDLFPESSTDMDLVRRMPVDCVISLSESLMQPKINFKIELPTAEQSIQDQVKQIIVTEEDVNKQMLSLLMLGRFYTPEIYAGKTTTVAGSEIVTNTASTTASELLSNQLSNWLSQISDQVDIGVNYRPGVTDGVKEISNDQIELALSTQVFNDRVTIDGNIGNNSNPSANNSGEFIGEFDIKVKLTNDGRLQLKVYNHSNDGILNEEEPYTQGIGLSYREEFNTLKDLFRKYRNAILKKKKKKTGPKNEN
ncbi:MAG TPA: translocation/assembly module TamB domain-containing protein, partial [Prolixibacteraceae bacterium]|nr:translocation/assembly module TamB domain-containing protein [Prolixibacteraceae bacterium]